MAEEMTIGKPSEGYAMNGGDGEYSYSINSSRLKEAAARSKETLVAAVAENLDIENLQSQSSSISSTIFRIADLGCSTGPNTYVVVDNIIEAVVQKYRQTQNLEGHDLQSESDVHLPEFQVYFSDLVSNDFNHLFANLPRDRQYFAAGVPGCFQGRLFPKASLNVVCSTYALQWLSKIPQELVDLNSPAYNKGRILYAYSPAQVIEAYSLQYAKDMQCFFRARAQEVAPQGLMLLLLPGRPEGTLPAQHSLAPLFEPIESTLLDLVNEGLISQDKFDSFNLPLYCPSVNELRELIEKNGCFDILKLEVQPQRPSPLPTTQICRAGQEAVLSAHFGKEMMEIFFDRYSKKIVGRSPITAADGMTVGLFVLLKRKIVD